MQAVSRLFAYFVQAISMVMGAGSFLFTVATMYNATYIPKLRPHMTTIIIGAGILGALALSFSLFLFLWGRRLIRFTRVRRAAFQQIGAEVSLALLQPQNPTSEVTLPLNISLEPDFQRRVFAWLVVTIITIIIVFSFGLDRGFSVQEALSLGLALGILFGILFGLMIANASRQQIEVTTDGLKVIDSSRKAQTIQWEEATLFAVIPSTYGGRTSKPIYYELAGTNKRVCWIRAYRSMPFFPLMLLFETVMKPGLPYDEYEQMMETLTDIIADKTKLPLYDLR